VGYEKLYRQDPRKAALQWLKDAKFGLFMHYGIYSQLESGEWVWNPFKEDRLPKTEYENLKNTFDPKNFDADFITDLALEAEMKYVNITSKHHDGFSIFNTKVNDYNLWDAPCNRDLIAELAEACQKKGLGFFTYFSHGREWRHPYSFNNYVTRAKGEDNSGDVKKKLSDEDWDHIYEFMEFGKRQITELLTNYGPLAGIWLDGFAEPQRFIKQVEGGERIIPEIQALYDHIHSLQPQVLVSYKGGLIKTEDYFAPELKYGDKQFESDKLVEYCGQLQDKAWGYKSEERLKRKDKDTILEELAHVRSLNANFLLNTGPLPDGSIHPHDVKTLREVGKQLRANGFPG
jgi:alpha-L-fucosidase